MIRTACCNLAFRVGRCIADSGMGINETFRNRDRLNVLKRYTDYVCPLIRKTEWMQEYQENVKMEMSIPRLARFLIHILNAAFTAAPSHSIIYRKKVGGESPEA